METVSALAKGGARVILCSRSVEAGEKVVTMLRSRGNKCDIRVMQLDLVSAPILLRPVLALLSLLLLVLSSCTHN